LTLLRYSNVRPSLRYDDSLYDVGIAEFTVM
jgi:hypothetical protein